MRRLCKSLVAGAALTVTGLALAEPADVVVTGARIYTAAPGRTMAQALAVKDGKIVYVGDDKGVKDWVGPETKVDRAGGRLILPGLFDSHIHPEGIVDIDTCDLKSVAKSLAQIVEFGRACLDRYQLQPGKWLSIELWNYTDNNLPDPEHPTLRAALDAISKDRPVQLMGNDGHHGAFNSRALALARNSKGETVGLSKATLETDFAKFRKIIGVDEHGEPNGAVNETARDLFGGPDIFSVDFDQTVKAPEKVAQRLNGVGITAILDAAAPPETMRLYDALLAKHQMTFRTMIAQYYDPERFRDASGAVDYGRMIESAKRTRAKYANNPLVHADFIKLFADGVLEGNPYAVPPTLPEGAALKPYLQPIFGRDSKGMATVTGYADTSAPLCVEVRDHPDRYSAAAAVAEFMKSHGYHPGQCEISSGVLEHDRDVLMEFARRFHLEGFTLHIHAIGDRAVRVAVDAIEGGRKTDGIATQHDSLAHVQLAHPDDVARIGRDHLYVAFTYSWAFSAQEYDMTVIPFFTHVSGNSYAQLHQKDSYYEKAVYPVRSVQQAGGILVAGSDAPVGTRDPQPFVNMMYAVTRALPGGQPAESAWEGIPVRDVIDAYTINGARFLYRDKEAGSLEVGKSADFIVLDQDVLKLADTGHPEKIGATRVLETWFQGNSVYRAPKKK